MTEAQVLAAGQLAGATLLETLLAQAFIRKYPGRFDNYEFNFRLGAGSDPGPTFDAGIRKMNVLLTQKRVDMVAEKGGQFALWELKARAGLASLGQLLGYRALWIHEGRPTSGLQIGIITRLVDADTEIALEAHAVQVEVFNTAEITAAATLPSPV